MKRVKVTVSFRDEAGTERSESHEVKASYQTDLEGEHWLAHMIFTEMEASVREHPNPKHNATAGGWLSFPKRPINIEHYFDVHNSQALWRELAGLVMRAEADLILPQAFKALEPAEEPPFGDATRISDLYFIHQRKMTLLNQSVHDLIKVQDLVNRLLHESFGGDLVSTNGPEWEKYELKRINVKKGLETKHAAGVISQETLDAISSALESPDMVPNRETVITYRNRLTHRVRPSVDYGMFYAGMESRAGEEVRDAAGRVVGRFHTIRAKPPAEYSFKDLHAAFSQYLDAIAAMLQKLSEIELIHR